ncbi:MAG: DUF501 domain-containing protein [Candidatus Riflebacteria bacterium]|nr:DUF501 domain-containing protein [Candidatus Riflebacteria bacterium]
MSLSDSAGKRNAGCTMNELGMKLLGRIPRLPFEIAAESSDGTAMVLKTDTIFVEDDIWKPFPTFLWLVCPRLKKLVSGLENAGYITKFEEKLKVDMEFQEKFAESQRKIGEIRWKLALEKNNNLSPEIERVLRHTTIAGSRSLFGVKCLHAHLAHYLIYRDNPIGAEIFEMVGKT